MPLPIHLTKDNFSELILQSTIPALVDFWSQTCGPCRMLAPILDQLAEEYDGYAVVGKVNVEETPSLGAEYGIDMLPTILIFHKGNAVEKMVGVQTLEKLQNALDELE